MIPQRLVGALSQNIPEQVRMRLNAQSLFVVVGGVQELEVQIGPDGTYRARADAGDAGFHLVVT